MSTSESGIASLAEGEKTIESGRNSHAEGSDTSVNGEGAHTEGYQAYANQEYTHAKGAGTNAEYPYSHAEGVYTTKDQYGAYAEGYMTWANGEYSHAEDYQTIVDNNYTHEEGLNSTEEGEASHAEGYATSASGNYSHAAGSNTIVGYADQKVIGAYNNNKSTTLFEVVNGISSTRSNALEVYDDNTISQDNGQLNLNSLKMLIILKDTRCFRYVLCFGEGGIPSSEKGAASGVAELVANGKVSSAQLSSYVDDVDETADFAPLPTTGDTGKIYGTLDDNKTYRWSGTTYVEISASLALGETDSNVYHGDRGKTAYDYATESGKISSRVLEELFKLRQLLKAM